MKDLVSLNENRLFQRVYRKGKSLVHPILVTYVTKNHLPYNRIGITATKKIGKACKRNRARRLIRESYRQLEPTLSKGWDLVFVARTKTTFGRCQDVQKVMEEQLRALLS